RAIGYPAFHEGGWLAAGGGAERAVHGEPLRPDAREGKLAARGPRPVPREAPFTSGVVAGAQARDGPFPRLGSSGPEAGGLSPQAHLASFQPHRVTNPEGIGRGTARTSSRRNGGSHA